MNKTILIFISISFFNFSLSANDSSPNVKSKELANGNTITVANQQHTNDAGTTHARRGYVVKDSDGDLVRRGSNRSIETADGNKAKAQRRQRVDEDGNTIQKRRRGVSDGEGNARGQAQRRVINSDGEVIARQRARGRNNADGSKARQSQKQKKLADGSIGEKRVLKTKSAAGVKRKKVVRRKK